MQPKHVAMVRLVLHVHSWTNGVLLSLLCQHTNRGVADSHGATQNSHQDDN